MDKRTSYIIKKHNEAVDNAAPQCDGKSVNDILIQACAMIGSCESQVRNEYKEMTELVKKLEVQTKEKGGMVCLDDVMAKLFLTSRIFIVGTFNDEFLLEEKNKKDDPMFG